MITLESIALAEQRADALEKRITRDNRTDLIGELARDRDRVIHLREARAAEQAAADARSAAERSARAAELAAAAVAELETTGAAVAAAISDIGSAVHRLAGAVATHSAAVRRNADALAGAGFGPEIEGAPGWPVTLAGKSWSGTVTVHAGGRYWRALEWHDVLDVAIARALGRNAWRGTHWPAVLERGRALPDAALDATPAPAKTRKAS